ncbi:MAG TPA: reverse transcriptase family protein, partial [Nitrososphaerales archaeon]|nr:reverse transcriptase family protein [Nitrososphaerales archaeon]
MLEAALEEAPEVLAPELRFRQKRQLVQMLYEEADCFAWTMNDLREPAEAPPLAITVVGGPVKQRFYRLAPDDADYLQQELRALREATLIRPSSSPWSSPTFVVRSAGHRPRKVVDYRKVNLLTVGDNYPLPDIHGIFDGLGTSTYFGTSDLKSGFLQVLVEEASVPITAFTSPYGLYDYLRAAFGLKNCPSHFMRCMDSILDAHDIRGSVEQGGGNQMFVDDSVSHGSSFEQYLAHQRAFFQAVREKKWKVNPKKLRLGYRRVKLLGYVIGERSLRTDPAKVEAVRKLTPPANVKQLQSFLGFVNFYRRLVPRFAKPAAALTS